MQEEGETLLNDFTEVLDSTMKPVNDAISKSYSQLGTMGATAKQKKALDSRIGEDMINMQDPIIQGALDMFPNVKEYVMKNPNLLIELLPRIQQLQAIPGFNPMDLIAPPSSPNPTTHPFKDER